MSQSRFLSPLAHAFALVILVGLATTAQATFRDDGPFDAAPRRTALSAWDQDGSNESDDSHHRSARFTFRPVKRPHASQEEAVDRAFDNSWTDAKKAVKDAAGSNGLTYDELGAAHVPPHKHGKHKRHDKSHKPCKHEQGGCMAGDAAHTVPGPARPTLRGAGLLVLAVVRRLSDIGLQFTNWGAFVNSPRPLNFANGRD